MKFSFLEKFKSLNKESILKDSIENLHFSTEDIRYAQKKLHFAIWTYRRIDQSLIVSNEIYPIFEEDADCDFEEFQSTLHPEDRDEVLKNIEGMLEGKAYDIEYRIITGKGKTKFIREKVDLFDGKDGETEKIIGLIQDITEDKILTEDLLSINQELYSDETIEGVGKWKFNRLEDYYYLSEELYRLYDLKPSEFQNNYRNLTKIIHPSDRYILKKIYKDVKKGKQSKEVYRIFTKTGSIKHLQVSSNGVFNSKGEVVIFYGTVRDISEEKNLELKLEDKENQVAALEKGYRNIIRESKDGFLVIDRNKRINFISESTEKIIECQSSKLLNQEINKLFSEKESAIILRIYDELIENPKQSLEAEINFRCKDGKEKILEIFMRNEFDDAAIDGILMIMRDVTQERLLEEKMFYNANHDQLTGLINRSCFLEKLTALEKEAEKEEESYLLMLIYINELKDIDLSFGYEVGDQLILNFVNRLKSILPKDIIISRYSDDNFALIIKQSLIKEGLAELAEDLIDQLTEPFKVLSYELFLKINIGAFVFPNDQDQQLSLKDSLKLALLRSKKLGVNRYNFYSSELNVQYYKNFTLRRDLKDSIKNKELEVYYQPLINIKDHRVVAAEALIRWKHPEWGLISPAEFIPLAEENGFIIEMGKWMMDKIFEHYKIWMTKGYPKINVGINFSAIQFFEKDFVKKVKRRIKKANIDPSFLVVEITENILMKNIKKINQDLEELKEVGIQIALDDFGTGYSSLAYLNSLNIDIIKIDQSFIHGLPTELVGTAITKATIKLAKELSLEIVAEGIENMEQLNYLKDIDAGIGQGYIFSRPVNEKDFERILLRKYCTIQAPGGNPLESEKNRRKFFRIEFKDYLLAEMTIQQMAGKEVKIGNTRALIKNIGPGGLCFISDVSFPVEKDLVFKFMTHLNGEDLSILGLPVQSRKIEKLAEKSEKAIYEYRIEFLIDEKELNYYTKLLNDLEEQVKNEDFYERNNFTSLSYSEYWLYNL